MNAVIDRVVQYPNRWKITNVDTGEVLGTFDFVPEVGTITQVGTKINKELFDSIKEDIEAKISSDGGDASKAIETFTASNTRTNLASGETISISMGKIYKWLSDLKALAFKDSLGKADVGLGNVDNTADKDKPVSTATQEALTGKLNASVLSDSTATFAGTSAKATADSSGNVISSHYRAISDSYSKSETPLRRYGRVCDNTSTAGTTWGKVADITMPVDYTDRNITFLVESGFSQHSRTIGILKLSMRNSGSATSVIVYRFSWLVKTDNADYPLSSFVAIQNGVNVSIYVKTSFQFDGIVFSELDEYNEQGYSTFGSYALYSVINPTITDLSTVAGTKTVSTMDVIENTAVSATNATNDDAGNRISTTYLSKADASSTYVEKSSIDSVPTASSANPVSSGGVKSALDAKQDIGGLAKVATSGSYNDLTDKPTLFSGSYNDLTDKPTIDATLSETSTNAVQNGVVTQAIKKAQGVTIKVLGNATDFFNSFFLNHYTSPVHSTVIKFELKNAVSLSLQTTYDFKKPILTKAVLVK
jgi:hypothetical protein